MPDKNPMLQISGVPGCLFTVLVLVGSIGGLIYLINLIVDGFDG